MPDGKPITDPETIAAYVRIARIVYGIDDDQHGLGEIDNPPAVVETMEGARVRAWLPVAALPHDDEIELDERRSRPSLVVADEGITDGLTELISEALIGRARTLAIKRAA